jgi:hypothetical protein
MLIPLGILAASGASAGSFDLLETQVLGTAAASVTFSNLTTTYGSTYQHLQLRMTARSNRSGADSDPLILRFNADSGSNYARHGLGGYNFGGTSAVYSNAGTSQTSLFLAENIAVASSTTNAFAALVTDILDPFETTKNKTVRTLNGMNAAWSSVELRSGLWLSTTSVTSITIQALIGSQLIAGSRFSLYGIKAA